MKEEFKKIPDIKEIEGLLGKFEPHPGQRFYDRMASAPWSEQARGTSLNNAHFLRILRLQWLRYVALPILVVLVLTFGLLVIPSWRAVAQNLLHFLLPAASDRIMITMEALLPNSIEDYSHPGYFSLSLQEAQEYAGYPVKVIQTPEDHLELTGAHYDPALEVLTLQYQGQTYSAYFSQRPAGATREYLRVGASAPIEIVTVRGLEGELVSGGWVAVETTATSMANAQPDTSTDLGAIWDPDLPQHTLRWQEDGFYYEIMIFGDAGVDKNQLIIMAERVK